MGNNLALLLNLLLDTLNNLNAMEFRLKQQYKDRIDYLQTKIVEQQKEIIELKTQISKISEGKIYEV